MTASDISATINAANGQTSRHKPELVGATLNRINHRKYALRHRSLAEIRVTTESKVSLRGFDIRDRTF
jgi:hypothetical protein